MRGAGAGISEMGACSAAHVEPIERVPGSGRVPRLGLQRAMTSLGESRTMRRLGLIIAVITVGALLVGGAGPIVTDRGPVITGSTAPLGASTTAVDTADRCRGGTEVSAFICRNTWMTWTRHAVR
jgi:hypothetical protein